MRPDPLAFARAELGRLQGELLLREVRPLDTPQDPEVVSDGERLLLFASNNYLGLANDPRVVDAAAGAAHRWGAGAGSARLITGAVRLHDELEDALAALKGAEAALLFSSGYLANIGTIAALTGRDDAIFSDELNHASVIDGARLSRAVVHVYRHADVAHLDELLRASNARRKLVVTDTVFSMDGDLAPLADICDVCERHGAIFMVDEAHATGVVGPGGRGAVAHFGLEGRVPVIMGTLSKALGAAGGYIAGSRDLIALLRNKARAFIFDTALPAPVAAAAKCAVEILLSSPGLPTAVRANATRLARGLGLPEPAAAILPIVVGEPDEALRLSAALRAGGILVPAIRPPSVPVGTARLRATVMATHSNAHIDAFVSAYEHATVAAHTARGGSGGRSAPGPRTADILFVTGTDTAVGKTVVSAVLARRARAQGRAVRYVKPLQTGIATGDPRGDAAFVAAAAGVDARELVRYEQPLAPAVAAELSGVPIDFDELVRLTLGCAEHVDLLLVEGAGGLLVPMTDERTMADFASALGARLVLVVRPGLGTLNHTALTLEAAVRRALEIEAIVISGFPPQAGVTERTNLERIRALGYPVEVVERYEDISVDDGRPPPSTSPIASAHSAVSRSTVSSTAGAPLAGGSKT